MAQSTEQLPLHSTVQPADAAELAAAVRGAFESAAPVYPIGGGTALDYGLPATRPGIGLCTTALNRIVDYPARDMTITVEAGVTMARLAETLAGENQWLPFDVPQSERATLGGVLATGLTGPRRYGHGRIRDFVIGVSAVDGRGQPFKGGGRVVKNVAGYDFCKLLVGSLGTLGVITQATLKLKPRPEASVLAVGRPVELDQAERLLAALATSAVAPSAIELVAGAAWDDLPPDDGRGTAASENGGCRMVVALEGTAAEVAWMRRTLADDWTALGARSPQMLEGAAAASLWNRLTEFPAAEAPLVVKASIRPGEVTRLVALARRIDPEASILAHAGSGVVLVRFAGLSATDVSRQLVGRLRPAAIQAGGNLVVLSSQWSDWTRQAWWGHESGLDVMQSIKEQFDPQGILNPGRFVYEQGGGSRTQI